jgi:hypothetical protein
MQTRRKGLVGAATAFVGVLLVTALLVLSEEGAERAAAAQGKKGPLDPRGEPEGFKAGLTARYAIWHGKQGWHLRTTTGKKAHDFQGKITVVGGQFENVTSHELEKKGKARDRWTLTEPGKNEINFTFKTHNHIDGINFRVTAGATKIRFDVTIDGKADPETVYVGRNGLHPKKMPFALEAHP